MAAAVMNTDRTVDTEPESGDSPAFNRRIEFRLGNKLNNRISNNINGFKTVTLNPSSGNLELQMASGSDKKCEGSEFPDSGLDSELSFRITFRKIGAGLRNLGNTCFLNSVLQCLTYTEPLAAYLQSGKHQISCRTAGFCALCAIQKHVSRALQSTGRILEPKDLVSNLRRISQNFRIARQEDAHEYMVHLLESMHKCCLPSGVPFESPSAYEKSLVHKIFGGLLRSQVKCMQCSFCSDKFDPFLDLSLEIRKADSLYKALTHFTAEEQLDGGTKQYQCQQCKQKVEAVKQLTIQDAPHVLTIHLKRFGPFTLGQKINKRIEFGATLDLKPFVTGPYDGDLKYTLYGVLVHAGWSTHSGHYYCFVRTSTGMWYSLDDNQVVPVNERRVLEQKAYMLFYVRDSRNLAAKKPVNALQEDNIVKNDLENAAYSKSNPALKENVQNSAFSKSNAGLKEHIENGLNEINLDDSPLNLAESSALNSSATGQIPMEVGSSEKVDFITAVECVSLENNTQPEPSSVVTPPRGTESSPSGANINPVDRLENLVSPVKVSGDTLNLDHTAKIECNGGYNAQQDQNGPILPDVNLVSPVQVSGDNFYMDHTAKIEGNGGGNAQQDLNAPGPILPDIKEPQVCLNKKELNDFVAMLSGCSTDTSADEEQCNTLNKQRNCSEFSIAPVDVCRTDVTIAGKDGCYPRNNRDSTAKDTLVDVSPMVVGFESEPPSCLPADTVSLLPRKVNGKKPLHKVKKKAFKCQFASMQLSSVIIYGVAFRLQKKKNGRRKYGSLKNKKLYLEHLFDGNGVPSYLGPSTSEKSLPASSGHSFYSKRERVKCGSVDNGRISSIPSVTGNCKAPRVINNEVRERAAPNGNVPLTENQSPRSLGSASKRKLSAAEEPSTSESHRRKSLNGIMSLLTRGLEESNVPRWNYIDIDTSMSERTESWEMDALQIGYIGDEWDEEYDRGKRKRVKGSKINFGGPNLFQATASKNERRKKAKLGRSSSGHRPFRI